MSAFMRTSEKNGETIEQGFLRKGRNKRFSGFVPEVERAVTLHSPEHQIHLVQGFDKQDISVDSAPFRELKFKQQSWQLSVFWCVLPGLDEPSDKPWQPEG